MPLLTDRIRLDKQATERILHKESNKGIAIYNTTRAMRGNPFAGDTTIPSNHTDNRTDSLLQTEEDVLDSVLHPNTHYRVKKSDVRLVPDAVREDVKDFWRSKIGASILKNAKSKKDNC